MQKAKVLVSVLILPLIFWSCATTKNTVPNTDAQAGMTPEIKEGAKADVQGEESAKASIGEMSPGQKLSKYLELKEKANNALHKVNDPGAALDLANEALVLVPDSSEMKWLRFEAYRRLDHVDKARGVMEKLLEAKDVNLRDQYHSLGDFYGFSLGDYKTAIEWYSQQIALDPGFSGWAYCQRGNAYMQLKEYAKARLDFDRALFVGGIFKDGNLTNAVKDYLSRLDLAEKSGK